MPFSFTSDNLRGAFNDGIFLELIFLFMNFFVYVVLDFPHLFGKGLVRAALKGKFKAAAELEG